MSLPRSAGDAPGRITPFRITRSDRWVCEILSCRHLEQERFQPLARCPSPGGRDSARPKPDHTWLCWNEAHPPGDERQHQPPRWHRTKRLERRSVVRRAWQQPNQILPESGDARRIDFGHQIPVELRYSARDTQASKVWSESDTSAPIGKGGSNSMPLSRHRTCPRRRPRYINSAPSRFW